MFWIWETIFQFHFQGECFVELILGNADLGRRDSREGMIMQSVILAVTFPLSTTSKPGLPFSYVCTSLVIVLSRTRSRVLWALCLVYCGISSLCFSSRHIFPFYPWDLTWKILVTIFEINRCGVGWGLGEKQQWLSVFENLARWLGIQETCLPTAPFYLGFAFAFIFLAFKSI